MAMREITPLKVSSSLPLYEQLKQRLRTAILTEQYVSGDQLPPEFELCETYGVSRITARRAVQDLVAEGLLERRQGKGTFVAYERLDIHVMSLDGFSGFHRSRAPQSVLRILAKNQRGATAKEARFLQITEGAQIYELVRLLLVKEMPVALDRSVYDARRFPGLLDRISENTSTYELFDQAYHHPNFSASKEIVMTSARPDEAEVLHCKPGEALYLITKVVHDDQGVANHCSFMLVPGERVKLTISYKRTQI